ncbi:hypothetical protein [Mycolicibacterium baixiangningiae]|uniref:hypothetical protein n=1 Tax=Mycolicibacterium baixiangningiae TaxID=2761578 RepID=UPI0018D08F49|nr:hypothetical protein [Mycolicibacterium baixiangningiae]
MADTFAEVFRDCGKNLSEKAFHFTNRGSLSPAGQILLHAPDLATAQRERRRIQSTGDDAPLVLLEIEAVVADTYQHARAKLAARGAAVPEPSTIRYVGTAIGLAGLIADIAAAEVADGVVITPVPLSDRPTLILEQTIPWLQEHDLIAAVVNLNGQ